jgi:lipopolysaccharide export system protein LptC
MMLLPLLRRGLDRASIYLPIVLMGALALGSYWLVRNTPDAAGPAAAAAPPRHEPDYFMRDFTVKNFYPDGRLKSQIQGPEGRHYPDNDTLEVDRPRINAYGERGERTTATALHALSNGDGSEVQLRGNAIIVRDPTTSASGQPVPRMEFRGEFLHAFLDTEKVRSDQPVTLIRGADRFVGDNLDYDNVERVAVLRGRVRGTLQPAGGRR